MDNEKEGQKTTSTVTGAETKEPKSKPIKTTVMVNRETIRDDAVRKYNNGIPAHNMPGKPAHLQESMNSGRPYSGVNAHILETKAIQEGYHCPVWITYQDAFKAGYVVKIGEKGTIIEQWTLEEHDGKRIMTATPYAVFNIQQLTSNNLDLKKELQEKIQWYKEKLVDNFSEITSKVNVFLKSNGKPEISPENMTDIYDAVSAAVKEQTAQKYPNLKESMKLLQSDMASNTVLQSLGIQPPRSQNTNMEFAVNWTDEFKDMSNYYRTIRDSSKTANDMVKNMSLGKDIAYSTEKPGQAVSVDTSVEAAQGADSSQRKRAQALKAEFEISNASAEAAKAGRTGEISAALNNAKVKVNELYAEATAEANAFQDAMTFMNEAGVEQSIIMEAEAGKFRGSLVGISVTGEVKFAVLRVQDKEAIIVRLEEIDSRLNVDNKQELDFTIKNGSLDSVSDVFSRGENTQDKEAEAAKEPGKTARRETGNIGRD